MFLRRFAPFGFRESALASSYGMAECTALVTSSRMGEPATVDWVDRQALQAERRAVPAAPEAPGALPIVGSGWPVRGAELRVVDEQGRDLPERGVGQILVRCESMFKGYYGRPDLTEKVMRDSWHVSGDVGYLAGGQVHVTGRLKDLIIVAGRNIHPEDLEDAANDVEGIKRGRCVAFGVTDPRVGTEVVVMICELAAPLDEPGRQRVATEVRARVWRQEVALHDVRLVDDRWMIKTSSGKISRFANREKYLATFAPPELRG
jgi:acyl-CoA synthetase (AMP-forming)/AMP-acid ligase II